MKGRWAVSLLLLAGCAEISVGEVPPSIGVPDIDPGCGVSLDPDLLTLTAQEPSARVRVTNDCSMLLDLQVQLDDPAGVFALGDDVPEQIDSLDELYLTVSWVAQDGGPFEGQLNLDLTQGEEIGLRRSVELYAE